jgi:hypothetical protein
MGGEEDVDQKERTVSSGTEQYPKEKDKSSGILMPTW